MMPFILSVNSTHPKKNHYKDLTPDPSITVPLIPQILGNHSASFCATAAVLRDLGYKEVNWNLGCPYSMVANKKRGSGLLPFPELIRQFLETVCRDSVLPVSVKVRLGRYESQELIRVIPVLNDFPLTRVIIHARVATQMYSGAVDLDGFAEAAARCRHPVVYNGDIKDVQTFQGLQRRFPAINEWMIGRWALFNPLLADSIKTGLAAKQPLQRLRVFHDELYLEYREILSGPGHVLDKMKEVWSYLGTPLSGTQKEQVQKIRNCTAFDSYERCVDQVFAR